MLYFIPSWYNDKPFYMETLPWERMRTHTEVDDTLKHVQLMYKDFKRPVQLLMMDYTPLLRFFLHGHGIYKLPYWSCFDALQEVPAANAKPLRYMELDWPDDVEYLFSNFSTSVLSGGEVIAVVRFLSDGYFFKIERYANQVMTQQEFYDDRGFLSSATVYKDGKAAYREFYTLKGEWKLRHDLDTDAVEINPEAPTFTLFNGEVPTSHRLKALNYEHLESLLLEIIEAYIAEQTEAEDLFVVAADANHDMLVQNVLRDRKSVLTFFEERYPVEKCNPMLFTHVNQLVADSEKTAEALRGVAGDMAHKVVQISPYGTGKEVHLSTNIPGRNVVVPIDGMDDEEFEPLIRQLTAFAKRNKVIRVQLLTRNGSNQNYRQLLQRMNVAAINASRILQVVRAVDENACIKCMRDQRLLVDLRKVPDLYLQMLALSIGVPQIVMTESALVEHDGNGVVIENMEELQPVFVKYLGSIALWNEARVCSLEIAEAYSSSALESQWREVVENIG